MNKKPRKFSAKEPKRHTSSTFNKKPTLNKSTAPSRDSLEEWPMRLNKFVAHCGVCSRREAAELVKSGEIQVDGVVVIEPFALIEKANQVRYKGKVIFPEYKRVYLLMNKQKNTLTTTEDEKGRKTVMDLIKNTVKERVYPVGRLDRDTTGLLLLTNDGELAQKLSHPANKVKKVYNARLNKAITEDDLVKIRKGVELEDGKAVVDAVNYVFDAPPSEVSIEIHLGKNRIVRRIFEHLGYQVEKLDRVYYAGLTKKDLPRGKYRPLTDRELIMLRHFVK